MSRIWTFDVYVTWVLAHWSTTTLSVPNSGLVFFCLSHVLFECSILSFCSRVLLSVVPSVLRSLLSVLSCPHILYCSTSSPVLFSLMFNVLFWYNFWVFVLFWCSALCSSGGKTCVCSFVLSCSGVLILVFCSQFSALFCSVLVFRFCIPFSGGLVSSSLHCPLFYSQVLSSILFSSYVFFVSVFIYLIVIMFCSGLCVLCCFVSICSVLVLCFKMVCFLWVIWWFW